MNEIIKISFYEVDILEKETINFHIPYSKKLNDDHIYYSKRIIWNLVKWIDTEDYPYKEIEGDERNGIRYQEVAEQTVSKINGIKDEFIKDKLNKENCFQFDFTPSELDNLTLRSDYKFNEIKAIKQSYSRTLQYISLSYKNGIWVIDNKIEKRVVKKNRTGIVQI